MKVKASIPSVEEVEVNVSRNLSVAALKQLICDRIGIEPELTALLLDGKPLSDRLKIREINLSSKKITVDYLWARQLILWGKKGQSRIGKSKVLIAGAGALGNEVAKNLAMLGVEHLIIVDYDVVELSNVSRMIFFDSDDVGRPKTEVLTEKLRRKYPRVKTLTYNVALEKIPLNVFLDVDVIICGLDNVLSRIFLSCVSRRYLIPMVDGGIVGYQARVQSYIPPDSPCPICPLPFSQYGQLVGLRNPCDAPVEEGKTPSLSTTISLVSSIQAQEAIKIILGHKDFLKSGKWPGYAGEPLRGTLIVDLKFNRFSTLELNRNKNCIVCGKDGIGRDVVPRFEIPMSKLKNSAETLIKALKSKVGKDVEDVRLFKVAPEGNMKIEGEKPLIDCGLHSGDFIRAIFKKEGDEYKEVIVKLV